MSSKISKKVKTLQCPLDPSKAKIFRLLFGMEPSESELIAAYSDLRMIFICNTFTNQNLKGANMDYAEKFGSLPVVDLYCLSEFLAQMEA